MLFTLTACNKTGKLETEPFSSLAPVDSQLYVSEFIPLEIDSEYVYDSFITKESVYLIGETSKQIGVHEGIVPADDTSLASTSDASASYPIYMYGISLFFGAWNDGHCQLFDGYQSFDLLDGTEADLKTRGIYPGKDNTIWITTEVAYWFKDSELFLQQFDITGDEMKRIKLNELVSEGDEICNTMIDFEEHLYIETANKTLAFDSSQNLLFTVKNKTKMSPEDRLILLADGHVAACIQEDDIYTVQKIAPETHSWDKLYALPESSTQIYSGNGEHLFFCTSGDSLYGYNAKKQELERLLIWTGVNIDSSQILALSVFDDEELAVVISSGRQSEIAYLKKADSETVPETITLNYATLGIRSDVRADIVEFNKSHPDFRIEVHDYSEYNIENNRSQGRNILKAELMAGKVDILDTANLPIRQYEDKDLLEDLLPYLDSDPDFNRNSLVEHVVETAMHDGKLYRAFPSFSIVTAVGRTDIVGNRLSWTLEELAASLPENCSIFGAGETKESLLAHLLPMNLDCFVDWNTGKCSFTSKKFINLLKFCNNSVSPVYEEEDEGYKWITEGKQLLLCTEINTLYPEDYLLYPTAFGGTCSFIGYPQQDGSIGSCFKLGDGMAITAFCKNKEAAWAFVRNNFLPKYPTGMYFGDMLPINLTDYHRLIEMVTTPAYEYDADGNIYIGDDGQPVEMVGIVNPANSDLEVPKRAIQQDELKQFVDLVDSIERIYSFDDNIYSIVLEETKSYFSGDKTIKDVTNRIQSRVSSYINKNW